MKIVRSVICLVALLGVLAAGTPTAAAVAFLGEFCGWYTIFLPPCPPSPAPGGVCLVANSIFLKAGVTHLGGPNFLLQGVIPQGQDDLLFLQATGVIVGSEVWLNGSTTQDHVPINGETARDSGLWQARLNLSSLSGPFWNIQTDITTTDGFSASFEQKYVTGMVSLNQPCF